MKNLALYMKIKNTSKEENAPCKVGIAKNGFIIHQKHRTRLDKTNNQQSHLEISSMVA